MQFSQFDSIFIKIILCTYCSESYLDVLNIKLQLRFAVLNAWWFQYHRELQAAQIRSENLGKAKVVQATPERRSKRIKERENKQTQKTTHTGLPLVAVNIYVMWRCNPKF